MKFLKRFATLEAFANFVIDENNSPNVTYIDELAATNNGVRYKVFDYATEYFTLIAVDNCYFSINVPHGDISYSTDNGITWNSYSSCDPIEAPSGTKILLKGNNYNSGWQSCQPSGLITGSNNEFKFDVQGNIMSLIYGDNFVGKTVLNAGTEFTGLFLGSGVRNAENLILPATTLSYACYSYMFCNCPNLIKAPKILPATILASTCYANMFEGCFSLEKAPELPALTLVANCYNHMFKYCYALNYIKCLATDISAIDCTSGWMTNVNDYDVPNRIFVKNTNMNNWTIGDDGIPSGWIIQNA